MTDTFGQLIDNVNDLVQLNGFEIRIYTRSGEKLFRGFAERVPGQEYVYAKIALENPQEDEDDTMHVCCNQLAAELIATAVLNAVDLHACLEKYKKDASEGKATL